MTVQCPRCSTQYRVPEERLSHRRPTFKCTHCGHVFPAERAPGRGRAREPDLNLSFTFETPGGPLTGQHTFDDEETRTAFPDSTAARGEDEPAFLSSAGIDAPPLSARRPEKAIDGDSESDGSDSDKDTTSVLIGAAPQPGQPIRPRTTMMATPPGRRQRSPVRAVAVGVGLTLAGYLALALHLSRAPEKTLDTLTQVPLLGRLIADDNLLAWRLELIEVEGALDHIKGQRPAYIVSGRAVNTTGEPLRIIEVEGRLIAGGAVRQERRAYAANQFKKTVRELSASEVEMLLRLEPNRRFVVQPGESARFLIVFPDPPPDVTGVECRVVDARPA